MYSWFRRTLSRNISNDNENTQKLETSNTSANHNNTVRKIEEDEFYGVTSQLIEFVKSLNLDTFKNFSIPEEENGGIQTTSGGVRVDLSEWQQQHAIIILSKVKMVGIQTQLETLETTMKAQEESLKTSLEEAVQKIEGRFELFRQQQEAQMTGIKIGFGSVQIMSRICLLLFSLVECFPCIHLVVFLIWYELQAIRLDKIRKMATEKEKVSDTNGIELEMTEAKQSSSSAPP
uniref:Uncharacterized protein n=1 Tax=Chenopodium quinoa TaxID=63459 RepID=A0A803MLI8_CHEQI